MKTAATQDNGPPRQAPTVIETTDLPLVAALISEDGRLSAEKPFQATGKLGRPAVEFRVETMHPELIEEYRRGELYVNVRDYEMTRRHLLSICSTMQPNHRG